MHGDIFNYLILTPGYTFEQLLAYIQESRWIGHKRSLRDGYIAIEPCGGSS